MKTIFNQDGDYAGYVDTDNARIESEILSRYDNTYHIHDGHLDDPGRWRWNGSALVERADYAAVLAARALKPVTVIDVPVAAAVSTPITGSIQVKDASSGAALPVNKTYYVPLMNKITGAMDQMIAVTLANGSGPLSFQVAVPGIYGIRTDLIIPAPATEITGQTEIAIY
ncbi:MAG: hypothetical protein KGN35_07430 [Betaproteobacteria bacterium]|nr:hypothetical protein [Betaproteobacteria bacterium]